MNRIPLDARPLRDRLLEAATAPTADQPATEAQKGAFAAGEALHAKGSARPNDQMAGAIYGDEAPWLIQGWDDAAKAAAALHEVAATGAPTTCDEVMAISRGKELHAAGKPRPSGPQMWFHYKERYPWLLQGWDTAQATVEPATFMCSECGDEEHPLVPGEDDSTWCVCDARLDEQRDRIAQGAHDFETEGRQSESTVTPCAICGLDRSAAVHR